MTKGRTKSPADIHLFEVLEGVDAEVPLPPEERDALLKEANYDVEGGLREAMALIQKADAVARRQALEARRGELLTGLPSLAGKLVHRTREESLALIRALTAQLPANTPQLAYFRNYESAPEGDLDLLVAELQALTEKE